MACQLTGRCLALMLCLLSGGSALAQTYVYKSQFGSSGSANGQFSSPYHIAIDPTSHNIVVADRANSRVQIFNASGAYLSQFGTPGSGAGQLMSPDGVAIDPISHNIVVTDESTSRVQIFSSAGVYIGPVGTPGGSGNGQTSFCLGVAIDPVTQNIFVLDSGNNRIQVFNSAGVYQSQFGSSGSGNGQFNAPFGIAIDPTSHNIVVADTFNRRVQIFNSSGVYQSQFGSLGTGNGQFSLPYGPVGVAIDPTSHNIVVTGYSDNRVQVFNSAGVYLSQFGSPGIGNGQLSSPLGIAIDPTTHDVVVVDSGNSRVQIYTSPKYVFTSLDYPGAVFTDVRGINNAGQIVGSASYNGATSFPFIYQGGVFSPLPPLAGQNDVSAQGVNDSVSVTGGFFTATGEQAFLFSAGAYTVFTKQGWGHTVGRAIGPSGLITGFASNQNPPGTVVSSIGFLYDPATKVFTDIAIPGAAGTVIAQGINTAGQIVGSADNVGGKNVSFLRQPNGAISTFQINGKTTKARGISDTGLITGFSFQNSKTVGFIGDSSGYQLLDLPNSIQTIGEGINNLGQVVGFWVDAANKTHGFIATPATLPSGTTAGGAYTFSTAVIPNKPIVLDPLVAIGYDFAIGAGDPLFATVRLPIGIGDSHYTVTVGATSFTVAGGDVFDFTTHGFPGGVPAFRVSNIEVSTLIDPADQTAFAVELTFVGPGNFTGTQTPLSANLFTVINNNDNGPGSLRDAVAQSNATPGVNAINFAPNVTGSIVLTSGQIRIDRGPLTIVGPGADVLTIDGNSSDRIFRIGDSSEQSCPAQTAPTDYLVTISGLTLQHAQRSTDDSGGAINSLHSVALDSVRIQDSAAKNAGGLQIQMQYAGQSLAIANSQFLGNAAKPLSVITGNSNSGGALRIVENCSGARTAASVDISNSLFQGNFAQPDTLNGFGGAIASFSYADISIADSRIVGNHVDIPLPAVPGAKYRGGGIYGSAKSLTIVRSEISGNTADEGGGLIVVNDAADLQTAGSAMAVHVINSTVSGNTAATTAGAEFVFGNVAMEIDNSTIAANTATDSSRAGGIVLTTGATSPASGGNATAPTLTLVSSILTGNSSNAGDVATNTAVIPTFTIAASHALIQKICAGCSISVAGSGNLLAIDPLLGPLADNGGQTQTHALLSGSPAINAGSNPLGLTTDQRYPSFARVLGPTADMGAFEAVYASLDVDLSGAATRYDPLTDGLLIVRYLFGLSGPSLTANALGGTAARGDPDAIRTYLDGVRDALDIDGNGTADALTDGLLIVRYMSGLRGSALIAGIADPAGSRKTSTDIENYLKSLMP